MAILCRIIGHNYRLRQRINEDEVWICLRCLHRQRLTPDGIGKNGFLKYKEIREE